MTGTFAFFRICLLIYSPSKIIWDCQQIWQSKNTCECTEPATRRFSIKLLFWKIWPKFPGNLLARTCIFPQKGHNNRYFSEYCVRFYTTPFLQQTSRQMHLDTSISTSNNMLMPNIKLKLNITSSFEVRNEH